MKTKELSGVGKTTFKIVLSEDWQSGEYILGCDPYEKENVPINLYHKIRKFFRNNIILKMPRLILKKINHSLLNMIYQQNVFAKKV